MDSQPVEGNFEQTDWLSRVRPAEVKAGEMLGRGCPSSHRGEPWGGMSFWALGIHLRSSLVTVGLAALAQTSVLFLNFLGLSHQTLPPALHCATLLMEFTRGRGRSLGHEVMYPKNQAIVTFREPSLSIKIQ